MKLIEQKNVNMEGNDIDSITYTVIVDDDSITFFPVERAEVAYNISRMNQNSMFTGFITEKGTIAVKCTVQINVKEMKKQLNKLSAMYTPEEEI